MRIKPNDLAVLKAGARKQAQTFIIGLAVSRVKPAAMLDLLFGSNPPTLHWLSVSRCSVVGFGFPITCERRSIRGEISLSISAMFGNPGPPEKPGFGFLGWNLGNLLWPSADVPQPATPTPLFLTFVANKALVPFDPRVTQA